MGTSSTIAAISPAHGELITHHAQADRPPKGLFAERIDHLFRTVRPGTHRYQERAKNCVWPGASKFESQPVANS
jgi:hypothetical protein